MFFVLLLRVYTRLCQERYLSCLHIYVSTSPVQLNKLNTHACYGGWCSVPETFIVLRYYSYTVSIFSHIHTKKKA